MSEPNSKEKLAIINLKGDVVNRISQLYMSEICSDIVFKVEGEKIPAHKCILATANTYFQNLLYGDLKNTNQNEIELEGSLDAFKVLLRFIYSGKISLLDLENKTIVDTLVLSYNCELKRLESAIIEYLKGALAINNVCGIFNVARLCEMDDLIKACYAFMDRNAIEVLAHESFLHLTKESLQDVLRRSTFLAPEFQIFTVVNGWCTRNPDVDFDSVLSNVRLPLMNVDEHVQILKTGMITADKLMEAMAFRNSSKSLPYRVWPGENMAALKYRSKVIQGKWETNIAQCNISAYDLDGTTVGAMTVTDNQEIIIKLGIISIINRIEIMLQGQDVYSYVVEVSENQTDWTMVADYGQYKCNGLQFVYFPSRYVKYIKLTGMSDKLTITTLKAFYTNIIPKSVNGFIARSIEIYGMTEEEGEEKKEAIFKSTKSSNKTQAKKQLRQPHYIETLRLFLCANTNSSEYVIEVSTNDRDWRRVEITSFENGSSWRDVSCGPIPVVYIKISSKALLFGKTKLAHLKQECRTYSLYASIYISAVFEMYQSVCKMHLGEKCVV